MMNQRGLEIPLDDCEERCSAKEAMVCESRVCNDFLDIDHCTLDSCTNRCFVEQPAQCYLDFPQFVDPLFGDEIRRSHNCDAYLDENWTVDCNIDASFCKIKSCNRDTPLE